MLKKRKPLNLEIEYSETDSVRDAILSIIAVAIALMLMGGIWILHQTGETESDIKWRRKNSLLE